MSKAITGLLPFHRPSEGSDSASRAVLLTIHRLKQGVVLSGDRYVERIIMPNKDNKVFVRSGPSDRYEKWTLSTPPPPPTSSTTTGSIHAPSRK